MFSNIILIICHYNGLVKNFIVFLHHQADSGEVAEREPAKGNSCASDKPMIGPKQKIQLLREFFFKFPVSAGVIQGMG